MKSEYRAHSLLLLLGLLAVAFSCHPVSGWRIYALSNTLDVWQQGSWTKIPLVLSSNESFYSWSDYPSHIQVGQDRVKDVFITATDGIPGARPWRVTRKLNSTTNTWLEGSWWIGRWAFDSDNNFYSVYRYSPAPPPRAQIVRIPSTIYDDHGGPQFYIGRATGTRDITSYRNGSALVLVGAFTEVYDGNDTNPVSALNVALWDTKLLRWLPMGSGIPYPPSRVVSNRQGTELVALTNDTSILWRWNATSQTWTRYNLTLTTRSGLPAKIRDLMFGGNSGRLFLVGDFFRFNGKVVRNVSMIQFSNSNELQVTPVGIGLPGGDPWCLFARSESQIFVGGATKGLKVVYEWRANRSVPWDRIGALGYSPGRTTYPWVTPVQGLTVVE